MDPEKRPALRVLDLLSAEPWAISAAGMRQIVEIASRESDLEAVEMRLGRQLEHTRSVSVRDGVAIIPVTGPIFRYANLFTRVSGATSVQDLATDFQAAIDDPAVKAIVLNIDSPGGTGNGTGEFAAQVFAQRGKKPIVAYGGGNALSAAYWIGAAADEFVGFGSAYFGSVGTVMTLSLPGKAKDGAPREVEFVSSQSPNKRIDPESDSGKAEIQTLVDDHAAFFVSEVARFRGTDEAKVLADYGQGSAMIAPKAKEAGMIDRIATLEEVISQLAARSGKIINAAPRFAAKENQMDPKNMDLDAAAAQLAELKAENEKLKATLSAESARIETETKARITAEVNQFTAPLLAAGDLRFNKGDVAVIAAALSMFKLAAAGVEHTDAKAIGAVGIAALEQLTASARPLVPSGTLPKPAEVESHDVTPADFKSAAQDVKAAQRISKAVAKRREKVPSFTADDLYREITH